MEGSLAPISATRAAGRRPSGQSRLRNVAVHGLLLLMVAATAIPLFYMVSTSLKPTGTEMEFPVRWLPERVVWRNYTDAFSAVPTLTYLKNTVLITVFSLIGELLTGSLVAYGFARLRFPGREVLFTLLLSSMMLPFFATMIPLFIVYKQLRWINTFLPLTVPAYFGGAPIYIFLMRQFYMGLPLELDDAAHIDGAGYLRAWWSVLLPLTRPALATVAILSLLNHWNDFLGPLIMLHTEDKRTLALGIYAFRSAYGMRLNWVMAYATMMTIPVGGVFVLFQKYFVRGINMTGLTGR